MTLFDKADGDGGAYVYGRQMLPPGIVQKFWVQVPFDPTTSPYPQNVFPVPGSTHNIDGSFYTNIGCLFNFKDAGGFLVTSMDPNHMGLQLGSVTFKFSSQRIFSIKFNDPTDSAYLLGRQVNTSSADRSRKSPSVCWEAIC